MKEDVAPAVSYVLGDFLPEESLQLTDQALVNLTRLVLTEITYFHFGGNTTGKCQISSQKRGTERYKIPPLAQRKFLESFLLLLGDVLTKIVSLASAHVDGFGNQDATECAIISTRLVSSIKGSHVSLLRTIPPTALWENFRTSKVAQMQLASNFARTHTLRLMVTNAGHDFNGQSLGLEFYKDYNTPAHTRSGMKLGMEILSTNFTKLRMRIVSLWLEERARLSVSEEGIFGGGHSPLGPLYGLAADHVLGIDIVTPDGRSNTASAKKNRPVLSWGEGRQLWRRDFVPCTSSKPNPAYPSSPLPVSASAQTVRRSHMKHAWRLRELLRQKQFQLTAPLFAKRKALGINIEPNWFEYSTFLSAWTASFPVEPVESHGNKMASRLFPRENLSSPVKFDKMYEALKDLSDQGRTLIGFGITADTAIFAISWVTWDADTSLSRTVEKFGCNLGEIQPQIRALTPARVMFESSSHSLAATTNDCIRSSRSMIFLGYFTSK
ncbi:FAD binding domain-containing protein [Colletotrichum asianum]